MHESTRLRVGDRITIYQRGKAKLWIADFWSDGQHCRVSLKTRNKKVAWEKALRLELKLADGTYRKAPAPTRLDHVVKDYLAYLETENRARKTLVKYRGILGEFVKYLAQHHVTRLHQVTPSWFDRFRAQRRIDHHRKTLYCEGVVIKQFFKWAKRRRLIGENPLEDIRLEKPPLVPKQGPSLEQVNQILAALQQPRRTMIALLAFTGMRAGELQRLKPEDMDLTANWIDIVSRQGAETKNRESRRVPIHPRLRLLLEQMAPAKRPWLFTAAPSRRYPSGDHPINIKRLNEDFQETLTSLGLPVGREQGFTLHSLRHFFETFCVNAGIPQRAIDTWLGHRSDKSMASVYYRLRDEDSQRFMNQVPFGPEPIFPSRRSNYD